LGVNRISTDVISDLDLDTNLGILQDYKIVIIAGHSEYWSIAAYDGVKCYLSGKGRLIVLSGNTMYWRVSFSPDGTIMECRKVDGAGAQINNPRRRVKHGTVAMGCAAG